MQESLGDAYKSEMAVWNKKSDSPHVHLLPPKNPLLHILANVIMKIGSRLGLDGLAGSSGWLLPFQDYFKRADVVHLHLIHGFSNFSILSLPMISHLKPIVWTIHDPWAMTGGCEHSFNCDRWVSGCSPKCPYPRCRSVFQSYTPWIHWRIKKAIYRRSDLTIIVASQWMRNRVFSSPLLKNFPCETIPFGVDLEVFRPRYKLSCRTHFGIPVGNKVIAFRDVGLKKDKFKGMRWLVDALNTYWPAEATTLLIFEDGEGFKELAPKYDIQAVGWLDGEKLALALAAADIFVMPSIQESFGLMAVEAMACGTPVIVFDGTALSDVIKPHLGGGVVVPAKDSKSLAEAIKLLLTNDKLRNNLSDKARRIAEKEYSLELYAQRHIKIYRSTFDRYYNK